MERQVIDDVSRKLIECLPSAEPGCEAFERSRAAVAAMLATIGRMFPRVTADEIAGWHAGFVRAICGQDPQQNPLYTADEIAGGFEDLRANWAKASWPKPPDIVAVLTERRRHKTDARGKNIAAVFVEYEQRVSEEICAAFDRGEFANWAEFQLRIRQGRDLAWARARHEVGVSGASNLQIWEDWFAPPLTDRERRECAR